MKQPPPQTNLLRPYSELLFDPGADIILRSRDSPGNATSELINSGGTAPWLTCCWTVVVRDG